MLDTMLIVFSLHISTKNADWLDSPWHDFFADNKQEREQLLASQLTTTGVDEEDIQHILSKFSSIGPENFVAHKGITRILKVGDCVNRAREDSGKIFEHQF